MTKQKEMGNKSKRTQKCVRRTVATKETTKDDFVRPILGSPGIIIEERELLATTSMTWKIIQQVNLEPLLSEGDKLMEVWRSLTQRCSHNNGACRHQQQLKNAYYQILNSNKDVDRALELIQGHKAQDSTRPKRALMSGVGMVSRYLFGTLDEASEAEIKSLIEGSNNNTNRLSNLLANQTEVIYKEFGTIQGKLEELGRKTQLINQQEHESQQNAAFTVAMQLFEESVFQYEMDTQILTDAILFGLQGIIHPRFLNFTQIEDTASVISKSVTEAAFPIEGEESIISELMKISDVTILLHRAKLVYYSPATHG